MPTVKRKLLTDSHFADRKYFVEYFYHYTGFFHMSSNNLVYRHRTYHSVHGCDTKLKLFFLFTLFIATILPLDVLYFSIHTIN